MCLYTRNYYIYTACQDPGLHFYETFTEGKPQESCPQGPHERYIVSPETCPICCG